MMNKVSSHLVIIARIHFIHTLKSKDKSFSAVEKYNLLKVCNKNGFVLDGMCLDKGMNENYGKHTATYYEKYTAT